MRNHRDWRSVLIITYEMYHWFVLQRKNNGFLLDRFGNQ